MVTGASTDATDRTAYSCSSRSFALARSSCSTWSPECSGHAVPASTRDLTSSPVRRTSISGLAPTSPSTANVAQVG